MGRYILSTFLSGLMLVGAVPTAAQVQTTGTISGLADDTANRPYTNYTVQLTDAATGEIVQTTQIDDEGRFAFADVELSRRFLVELVNLRINRVVCTEGPYVLATPDATSRTDVNIDCGAAPAAWWLLLAGSGTAAAIAFAVASPTE